MEISTNDVKSKLDSFCLVFAFSHPFFVLTTKHCMSAWDSRPSKIDTKGLQSVKNTMHYSNTSFPNMIMQFSCFGCTRVQQFSAVTQHLQALHAPHSMRLQRVTTSFTELFFWCFKQQSDDDLSEKCVCVFSCAVMSFLEGSDDNLSCCTADLNGCDS